MLQYITYKLDIINRMFSVSPYLFRSYNKDIMGPKGAHYSQLSNIAGWDLYELLKVFIDNNENYTVKDDSKQVYRFENLDFDDENRIVSVWFCVGFYGIQTDIIDIKTGSVDFEKAEENAEIIKYFMCFFVPQGYDEAIALTSNYRSNGVKTLFYSLFSDYVSCKTTQKLQMNPLSYDKALKSWLDARTTEIRCTKFSGCKDITDQITLLGHEEQELVFKPKKNKSLGKLRDFFSNGDKLQVIEVLSKTSGVIKCVVEMDGKQRTFKLGNNASNILCEIELDENVDIINGVPEFKSMQKWCKEIINEYAKRMYPGLTMS